MKHYTDIVTTVTGLPIIVEDDFQPSFFVDAIENAGIDAPSNLPIGGAVNSYWGDKASFEKTFVRRGGEA